MARSRLLPILAILLVLLWAVSSCSLLDTDDPVPAYLVIDEIDIRPLNNTDPNTTNFPDVWLFVDGQEYGVWTLPARIPIEATGAAQEILISPGIRANGVSGIARRYPYLDFFVVDQVLQPEVEYDITPVFEYLDIVELGFNEDFEARNIFRDDLDDNLETELIRVDTFLSRSGNHCGMIRLEGDNDIFQVRTEFTYDATNFDGPNVYLEFDVRGDIPLLVGYTTKGAFDQSELKVLVTESDVWKKMYIDLSDELTANAVDEYQIQFAASLQDIPATEGTIFIDNVRLLHF